MNLKSDQKLKLATLQAYEQMLKKPLGKAPVFKCQICFKYFQDQAYLHQHYERRHPDFYESERFRKQSLLTQNQLETADLVEQAKQQREEFFQNSAHLIDRYTANFADLQQALQEVQLGAQQQTQQHERDQSVTQ